MADRHGVGDEVRRVRGRQRNEARAVRVVLMNRPRELDREPRLADAPGSYEREQTLVARGAHARRCEVLRAPHGGGCGGAAACSGARG